jgi:hypothetical protein
MVPSAPLWARPVAHSDSAAGGDPGDRSSVDSEAFRDLLHWHPRHVGVDEFLTLRVAQTSLRLECLGCDWAALIASGRSFGSSAGGVCPPLTTGDERPEWGGEI